mmetsp:Transcript_25191/g.46969  ORF Transcript_25191/g.46969 Transcript_25191/m.46969 type:complete len:219 (-) Transcript_25191:37-693(-)
MTITMAKIAMTTEEDEDDYTKLLDGDKDVEDPDPFDEREPSSSSSLAPFSSSSISSQIYLMQQVKELRKAPELCLQLILLLCMVLALVTILCGNLDGVPKYWIKITAYGLVPFGFAPLFRRNNASPKTMLVYWKLLLLWLWCMCVVATTLLAFHPSWKNTFYGQIGVQTFVVVLFLCLFGNMFVQHRNAEQLSRAAASIGYRAPYRNVQKKQVLQDAR